jgi:hypothetical protein
MERTMNHMATLGLSLSVALAAAIGSTAPAAAQTTATSSGNLTTATSTSTTSTTVKKKPPTSATADMVNEAIQRSQARAAKEAQNGTPQQWGSEEPFTYNPAVKNFTPAQQ